MNKELGELKVYKSADYGKIIKSLEEAGFILVLGCKTTLYDYYIVAERKDKK